MRVSRDWDFRSNSQKSENFFREKSQRIAIAHHRPRDVVDGRWASAVEVIGATRSDTPAFRSSLVRLPAEALTWWIELFSPDWQAVQRLSRLSPQCADRDTFGTPCNALPITSLN